MDTALEGSGEVADGPDVVNGGEEDSGKGRENKGEGSLMEGIVDGLIKEESSRLVMEWSLFVNVSFCETGTSQPGTTGRYWIYTQIRGQGKNVMDTVGMMKAGCTAIVGAHRHHKRC